MGLVRPSGGIEELVDETSGREVVAAPPLLDRFAELMGKYEQFLGFEYRDRVLMINHVHEVLLPCDINLFLQQTRYYEDHKDYPDHTGLFISQLIQNSYTAGNNDFELDMSSLKPIDCLTFGEYGIEERVLKAVINGEVGNLGGGNSQHSTFTIEKAGNYCGRFAQYSTFTVEKAGDGCGEYAHHSILTIKETGDFCGSAAQHSIFKTHNSNQYERFKESVPRKRGNRLYLIAADGSIIKGGKW